MPPTKEVTQPTREDLRRRLDEHQTELAEADRQVGAAHLDSDLRGLQKARKRASEARAAVDQTEAAIAELGRRGEMVAAHQAKLADAEEKAGGYQWAAEHFALAAEVVATHEAAKAALVRFRTLGSPTHRRAGEQFRRRKNPTPRTPRLLDEEIVGSTVSVDWSNGYQPGPDLGSLRELHERSKDLAAKAEAEAKELRKAS